MIYVQLLIHVPITHARTAEPAHLEEIAIIASANTDIVEINVKMVSFIFTAVLIYNWFVTNHVFVHWIHFITKCTVVVFQTKATISSLNSTLNLTWLSLYSEFTSEQSLQLRYSRATLFLPSIKYTLFLFPGEIENL